MSKVVMSLAIVLSINPMERPPLTPVKAKRSLAESTDSNAVPVQSSFAKRNSEGHQKENTPVKRFSELSLQERPAESELEEVVTPSGKAVRVSIIRKTIGCIEGLDEKTMRPLEIHPVSQIASPSSLKSILHSKSAKKIYDECLKFGITPEKIKACYPAALLHLQSQSFLLRTANLQASSDLETEFRQMAQRLGKPDYHIRNDGQQLYAANFGDLVMVNEDDMKTLSVQERTAVYAHEIMHGKHSDAIFTLAVGMAFFQEGKHDHFKVHIESKLRRTCEVFADMGVAVSSPTLARNIVSLRNTLHARNLSALQEVEPASFLQSHPESGAWLELDKEYVTLHEKHTQEKERRERLSQAAKRFRHRLENESGSK